MLLDKLSRLGIAAVILSFSPLKASASTFSDFVFFGDSVTDSGNVFVATGGEITVPPFGGIIPQRPYASQTFSNDLVWAQYLADFNGLSAEPSLIGGTNFAFGGATNQPLEEVPSPSLEEQFIFWQQATGNQADPDALYFIQGGGNDVRIATTLDNSLEADILLQNAVDSLDTVVTNLIDAGATNIAVLNSPDIGLLPDAIFNGVSSEATALSQFYNTSLEQSLLTFDSEEVNLISVDLFGFINSITSDPTAFGLPANTVTDLPCILPDSVCSNPNEYIFYDGIHPTSVTQFQFAQFVNEQINEPSQSTPEPSTLIMGLGCAFVLAIKKKVASQ